MTASSKPALKAFLHGLAWFSLVVAGLSFWVGGRAISEFGKVDRIMAEFLGLSIAGGAGLLGYILKEKANGRDDMRLIGAMR
jgi:hypothetical protein